MLHFEYLSAGLCAFVYLMKQSFATGQNIVIDGGAVLV
jgi:hypothetical protein